MPATPHTSRLSAGRAPGSLPAWLARLVLLLVCVGAASCQTGPGPTATTTTAATTITTATATPDPAQDLGLQDTGDAWWRLSWIEAVKHERRFLASPAWVCGSGDTGSDGLVLWDRRAGRVVPSGAAAAAAAWRAAPKADEWDLGWRAWCPCSESLLCGDLGLQEANGTRSSQDWGQAVLLERSVLVATDPDFDHDSPAEGALVASLYATGQGAGTVAVLARIADGRAVDHQVLELRPSAQVAGPPDAARSCGWRWDWAGAGETRAASLTGWCAVLETGGAQGAWRLAVSRATVQQQQPGPAPRWSLPQTAAWAIDTAQDAELRDATRLHSEQGVVQLALGSVLLDGDRLVVLLSGEALVDTQGRLLGSPPPRAQTALALPRPTGLYSARSRLLDARSYAGLGDALLEHRVLPTQRALVARLLWGASWHPCAPPHANTLALCRGAERLAFQPRTVALPLVAHSHPALQETLWQRLLTPTETLLGRLPPPPRATTHAEPALLVQAGARGVWAGVWRLHAVVPPAGREGPAWVERRPCPQRDRQYWDWERARCRACPPGTQLDDPVLAEPLCLGTYDFTADLSAARARSRALLPASETITLRAKYRVAAILPPPPPGHDLQYYADIVTGNVDNIEGLLVDNRDFLFPNMTVLVALVLVVLFPLLLGATCLVDLCLPSLGRRLRSRTLWARTGSSAAEQAERQAHLEELRRRVALLRASLPPPPPAARHQLVRLLVLALWSAKKALQATVRLVLPVRRAARRPGYRPLASDAGPTPKRSSGPMSTHASTASTGTGSADSDSDWDEHRAAEAEGRGEDEDGAAREAGAAQALWRRRRRQALRRAWQQAAQAAEAVRLLGATLGYLALQVALGFVFRGRPPALLNVRPATVQRLRRRIESLERSAVSMERSAMRRLRSRTPEGAPSVAAASGGGDEALGEGGEAALHAELQAARRELRSAERAQRKDTAWRVVYVGATAGYYVVLVALVVLALVFSADERHVRFEAKTLAGQGPGRITSTEQVQVLTARFLQERGWQPSNLAQDTGLDYAYAYATGSRPLPSLFFAVDAPPRSGLVPEQARLATVSLRRLLENRLVTEDETQPDSANSTQSETAPPPADVVEFPLPRRRPEACLGLVVTLMPLRYEVCSGSRLELVRSGRSPSVPFFTAFYATKANPCVADPALPRDMYLLRRVEVRLAPSPAPPPAGQPPPHTVGCVAVAWRVSDDALLITRRPGQSTLLNLFEAVATLTKVGVLLNWLLHTP